jgi:hypothetical protein
MNWYLADDDETSSWRLQELPDTDVGTAEAGPTSGRAYEVFYNQTRVGRLEIHGKVFYGRLGAAITKIKALGDRNSLFVRVCHVAKQLTGASHDFPPEGYDLPGRVGDFIDG